jgi:N-acetylneuraminate lyase
MRISKLSGLIAAPHTAFTSQAKINTRIIPRQAKLLIQQKVTGAYICGTTGEGISCSVEEREAVMKAWVDAAKNKLFIIAHVGALSIADIKRLVKSAQKIGVDAISIVPPNFFKPGSVDALITFIQEATKGCKLPFYYYHTGMSGVTLDMVKFLEKADGRLPYLAGIKFNYPDLYLYQNCLRACHGKYDIVWGIDEWFAGAIACGAKAAIGSTYNYAAPLYYRIWENMLTANLKAVESDMTRVCKIVDVLVEFGGVAAGKAMMQAHGLDLGTVRYPLTPLTDEQKKTIVSRLVSIGGFYE